MLPTIFCRGISLSIQCEDKIGCPLSSDRHYLRIGKTITFTIAAATEADDNSGSSAASDKGVVRKSTVSLPQS
jgi:hypothetical protein